MTDTNDLEAFRVELGALINRHSLENRSDTPDWILAEHLVECLRTFEATSNARRTWHDSTPATVPQVEESHGPD